MWKFKKKIWPKNKESIPTGKVYHQRELVSSPSDIKNLLTKEYIERLRPRPSHPEFENVDSLKKESLKAKLKEATERKSSPWTLKELDNVLCRINANKSRDPHGFNRSIFHTNCIGNNLKESLLIMFNNLNTVLSGLIFTNSAPLGRVGHRVAMSVCVSVCLSVCVCAPSSAVFFEASHWPSGHMTRSWPLIGQPRPPLTT